jgi:monoamine oxidase
MRMEIVIIGAGAAGLTAARQLSERGKKVTVIEARDRIGGRIHTLRDNTFTGPIEAGAEFIHGDLKRTKALLNEAKIPFYKGEGKMWNAFDGKVHEGDFFSEGWDELIAKLKSLESDIPISEFLYRYFSDSKYDDLRESVIGFVSGYDAADPDKASAFALRDEWSSDDDITGYHPSGGYGQAMEFLKQQCDQQNVAFHFRTIVNEITWRSGSVKIITTDGRTFEAQKVLITIPPAVLKSGNVKFTPEIPEQTKAIQKIETGSVIKFLVEFHEAYWEQKDISGFRSLPGLHFLFSDAPVPTWWTQKPNPVPLLTGWLAGPRVDLWNPSNEDLLQLCYQSLQYVFDCDESSLRRKIRTIKIINWKTDPFSSGAYAYKTIESNEVSKILSKPINDTIYFAGEAYYDGPEMGTVEAALASGENIATAIP